MVDSMMTHRTLGGYIQHLVHRLDQIGRIQFLALLHKWSGNGNHVLVGFNIVCGKPDPPGFGCGKQVCHAGFGKG